MNNKIVIGGFTGLGATTLIALIHDIYQTVKMNKVCEKLNTTIDEISKKNIQVDIEDLVVKTAIEDAARRAAAAKVNEAANTAIKEVAADFHEQIRKAVDLEYDDIKDKVKKILEEEVDRVGTVGVREMKREIMNEAKRDLKEEFKEGLDEIIEEGKETFNDKLNDILEDHKDQLRKTRDIYSSIHEALGDKR